ncbi:hypothetical protein DCC81_08255 [Chitinophaga parva]|uniref:Probable membrane transporter protein n=1 Tax=Chitinophaga parva TaxID=2169414 RepID=A0A2T7BP23_9BACT|nr:sulfite exporter TauE/SafE family protein [Chitinophaga parva]PUZ29428.1 hypothetical protein DCC81_08255 [Chitinophaga parva]
MILSNPLLLFYALLLLVAFLYASVGHGGASGYLALMALFGIAPAVMKPTALLLNLFVSLTAFIQFYRGKYFSWKIFIPLALASIPLSFIGGMITVDGAIYKKMLGVLLLLPVIRFFFFQNVPDTELKESNPWWSLLIGGAIGLLSGMIGIGGGVILSPVLLLLRWSNQKQAAAISALFIFVNSLAGLGGQLTKGIQFTPGMISYVLVAFLGGLLGAWVGARKFSHGALKYLLGTVLAIAAYKLLFTGA